MACIGLWRWRKVSRDNEWLAGERMVSYFSYVNSSYWTRHYWQLFLCFNFLLSGIQLLFLSGSLFLGHSWPAETSAHTMYHSVLPQRLLYLSLGRCEKANKVINECSGKNVKWIYGICVSDCHACLIYSCSMHGSVEFWLAEVIMEKLHSLEGEVCCSSRKITAP